LLTLPNLDVPKEPDFNKARDVATQKEASGPAKKTKGLKEASIEAKKSDSFLEKRAVADMKNPSSRQEALLYMGRTLARETKDDTRFNSPSYLSSAANTLDGSSPEHKYVYACFAYVVCKESMDVGTYHTALTAIEDALRTSLSPTMKLDLLMLNAQMQVAMAKTYPSNDLYRKNAAESALAILRLDKSDLTIDDIYSTLGGALMLLQLAKLSPNDQNIKNAYTEALQYLRTETSSNGVEIQARTIMNDILSAAAPSGISRLPWNDAKDKQYLIFMDQHNNPYLETPLKEAFKLSTKARVEGRRQPSV